MYQHSQIRIVDLRVAKWGNSLALRIPTEIVRRLVWREGAALEVRMNVDGSLSIRPAQWDPKAFALERDKARRTMRLSESMMEELRSGARY